MAQTPASYYQDGETIDYTPGSAVGAGEIVLLGTIPALATRPIAANTKGALVLGGVWKVPKTSDEFTAGDAVYWDVDGDPVTGTAGTGAADSSAATGNLMGYATADAAAGDSYVYVHATAAKRTATIAGSVTADDITGSDSSLGITGLGAAAGGAIAVQGGTSSGANAGGAVSLTGGTGGAAQTGGAASVVGGVPASGNAAGGAASLTGGAGSGTGAGGAASLVGGASGAGATGNGGAVAVTGGAAASTNGNGGSVTVAPGALAGTGAPGKIHLNGFVAGFKAQVIDMADGAVTLTRVPGTPTGTLLTGNILFVDPNSGGASENLLLPPEADMADVLLIIKCTGGEHIALQNDAGGAVGTIEDAEAAIVHCDGTTWRIIQFTETT